MLKSVGDVLEAHLVTLGDCRRQFDTPVGDDLHTEEGAAKVLFPPVHIMKETFPVYLGLQTIFVHWTPGLFLSLVECHVLYHLDNRHTCFLSHLICASFFATDAPILTYLCCSATEKIFVTDNLT